MPVNQGFQNFSVQSIIYGHTNSAEKIQSKQIWRPYEDAVHNQEDDTEAFCAEVYNAFFPQDKEILRQQTGFYPIHFHQTDSDSSNTSSPVMSMETSSPSISPRLDNLSPTASFSNTGSQTKYRRTKYTKRQIAELNEAFNRSVYLTTKERNELSKKLNISETQIKNWFQNKRMKAKRDFIHSVHHGQIIPLKNPSIPKYSRLPDNFFMSLPVPRGDYILGKC